eukprot:TRINITY_DN4077_c0_g1_i6.p1 TRINITY_DN4077_c0_g1~~TRINITY_DN4077_c0_g1_i6.p1  ORF type:complete len:230 (+),score=52.29 TRINITY_DN4077_c0_g1_i6:188-877(+)
MKQGHGVCTYADGSMYQGEWMNNNWEGEGKFIDKDGNSFSGTWYGGLMDGRMEITWHNGASFVGLCSKGLKQKGTYQGPEKEEDTSFLPSVYRYKGDWHGDLPHGQGTITYYNNISYKGTFSYGIFQGDGQLNLPPPVDVQILGKWEINKGSKFTVTHNKSGGNKEAQSENMDIFSSSDPFQVRMGLDGALRIKHLKKDYNALGFHPVVHLPAEKPLLHPPCLPIISSK